MGDMDLAQFALLAVNAFCLVIILWQMIIRWGRVLRHKPAKEVSFTEPVSVIICARNEAENLRNHLPEVLEQEYPNFEVVVVDDGSTDHTEDVLEELALKYKNLRRLLVEGRPSHITAKKYALTMGIKHAKHELLVFTDADCKPASPNWLGCMASRLGKGNSAINLGVSGYKRGKGLLNAFIRFETTRTALDYIGAALGKRAYMGVGRNMAYRKSLFLETKGFIKHRHVQGGDDDLFVNDNAKKHSTAVTFGKECVTLSLPEKTWAGWYRQKVRHLMVGKLYRTGSRRLLMLFAAVHIGYWLTFIIFLSLGYEPYLLLGGFVLKTFVQYLLFATGSKRLGIAFCPWYLPLLDLLLSVYYLILGPAAFFTRKITWKK